MPIPPSSPSPAFIPAPLINFCSCGRALSASPEPKGGQCWQPQPQALPTRLQQQICLVMFRRVGREQRPSRSTRKQGAFTSEITWWAGEEEKGLKLWVIRGGGASPV